MRYVLYLFTLVLVFVGGMLVGNVYLPARNSSMAASISVPDAGAANPAVAATTLETAERNLAVLGEALNSCPVVVGEEKDRLLNQINLLLARQDFDIKKVRFELEIAKNTPGTAVTSQFAQASAEYAAALKRVETMAQQFFPIPEPQAEEPASAETKTSEPNVPAKTDVKPSEKAETKSSAKMETKPAEKTGTKQAEAKPAVKTTGKETKPAETAGQETKTQPAPDVKPAASAKKAAAPKEQPAENAANAEQPQAPAEPEQPQEGLSDEKPLLSAGDNAAGEVQPLPEQTPAP